MIGATINDGDVVILKRQTQFQQLPILATNHAQERLLSCPYCSLDPAEVCAGSLCNHLKWQNLLKYDMVDFAFWDPDYAPSERPTPVAPVLFLPPKFRSTLRNIYFAPSAGSSKGRTRDLEEVSGKSGQSTTT